MDADYESRGYDAPSLTQHTVYIPQGKDYKVLAASRLAVLKGHDKGKELLVDKERVTIGRSRGCDFTLTDRAISAVHAELLTTSDGRLIRDLNSRNGIIFAGHRVNELQLQPGTQFQIGNNLVRFEPLDKHLKIPFSPHERFGRAHGRSVAMRELFAVLEKAAVSSLGVLLCGETGTGKELLAAAVHEHSRRKSRPFVVLDCGAVPADIFESTLFGHEKGAFTGADRMHKGVFEAARGGTLFLDEVGELPLALQPKLLRVLENKEVQRVGSVRRIPVDARIVAATNRDLQEMVEKGSFREDLLYRLMGLQVRVPPLRERPSDIMHLAERFVDECNAERKEAGLLALRLGEDSRAVLESYPWPGNVRELRNVIRRVAHLGSGNTIGRKELQQQMDLAGGTERPMLVTEFHAPLKEAKAHLLARFERRYVIDLLRRNGGNLTRAAEEAGVVRHHFRALCKRYGVPRNTGAS